MERIYNFTSKKRLIIFSIAFAIIGLVTTFFIGANPDTYACGGAPLDDPNSGQYNEPRVFLESQGWWQPTISGTENFGHVHVSTCFPRTNMPDGSVNEISGETVFHVRVMLHENPGTVRSVRLQITDDADNQEIETIRIEEDCTTQSASWNDKMSACVWWRTMNVDTARANYDGFQEFRFSPKVDQPNGDEMRATTGWQAYLANGKPVRHHRDSSGEPRDFIEARGWYDGANYANVRLASPLPYEIKGVWEPSVSLDKGSGGVDVEHHFVSVDPNFHHGNKGIIIKEGSGSYRGNLRIDTTQFADGWHKLFMRSDAPCDGSSGNDCGTKSDGTNNNVSTNSGVIVIPFFVNNGGGSGGGVTPPNPGDGGTDPVDNVDSEAPVVSIDNPINGDTVTGELQVSASASDNTAVTEVRFMVDGSVVASKSSSPYSHTVDTTNLSNGEHSIQVEALDASNNSGTSEIITINVQNQTAPPDDNGGGVVVGNSATYYSVADSQVKNYYPTRNYGNDDELRSVLYGSKQIESYLKFNVSGLQANPKKVVLRLYVTDKSKDAGSLYATNNSWQEDSITWDTRPQKGQLLSSVGSVDEGVYIEYDITTKGYVTGDGNYSFVLSKDSSDSVYFDSNDGQNKPELVITW